MRHCFTSWCSSNGQCCDPLESGMCTCMYSREFCLVSYNTTMWNIYDRERSTWIKFIKLHTKSRESLGSRFVIKCSSHQSNMLDPDQKYEWLGCIGTKGEGIIGITSKYWFNGLYTCTWFKWVDTVVSIWKHVSRTLSWNCVVITVQEPMFYTLM